MERDPRSLPPVTAVGLMPDSQYRILVEAVTDYAIYMLDPDGNIVSWNPGAQRFKGYTVEEIIGHNFARFWPEEDRAAGRPRQALETAAREGRFESEGWRVRKDGTRFWAHVVIDPIYESGLASGRVIGFAKITRDLSEREGAVRALNHSEERFRLLVQSVTDYAIYMLDPRGYVTNWNAGAQKIKGYLPTEIIGQHFSRFYTDEDRAAGEPARGLDTAVREGRFEKEGWRVRKDGTRFWANVVIDAIHNDRGELIGFAKVTRDITERHNAQRALEAAQQALFESQKMDTIGRLTGGIAHDFNNLLMVILGSLNLMRKRLPDSDPRLLRLLDNAMQGAQRGAALTQRMLAFARRQALKPQPTDLGLLVYGMTDLLQRSLGPQVRIEVRFPAQLDAVMVDANQLELALLNLTINARDALPEGGVIVVAAYTETLPEARGSLLPGRYVCLSVADRGEGMDETTLARAMEPFFTTKGVGKGTGLGLSMVHGLAEQSGGQLVLKSRPQEGTVAELWLPVAFAAGGPAIETITTAKLQESPRMRKLNVLAVDDDRLVLFSTVAMLEDLGHSVVEATSGQQALEILRSGAQSIDLVITDQAMPQMTGTQLADAIRAAWPALPVILATGYAEVPEGTALPRLGKPFFQEDLARALNEAFDKAET